MPSDADRFRPREQRSIAEQSPPAHQPSQSGPGAPYPGQQQLPNQQSPQQAPQHAPPQQAPQHAPPQHALPPYGAPQYGAPQYGAPQYGAPQYGAPQYSGPQHSAPRYASFDHRDAPLIHPGAAQASSAVPYGVPVYHAPAYGMLPQPARGLSITALVLGICSAAFAWTLVVVPIIGIIFGFIALRREPAGKVMAIVGLITSGIGLLLVLLLYLLPFVAFIGAVVLAGI